ncbi:hypothetical protein D9758_005087 [Tetrapyrgos nigripes]|uniref:BTB domain-containing protein n=1 Tax=Tetrapyrgos nigripes TaxID=182062 RepID=A0A8H5GVY1_9AGAR|nr:hypothetical protein D9758_005087 [Tetrapyrgos nigripes]
MRIDIMDTACQASENCHLPVDIILESCDGHRLGFHTTLLETQTDAFPLNGLTPPHPNEAVKMEESKDVLCLLAQFLHNTREPDLRKFHMAVLAGLFTAFDKWGIYRAHEMIRSAIRMTSEPLEALVLMYAKEEWKDDIEEVAHLLLKENDTSITKELVGRGEFKILVSWHLYTYAWFKRSEELKAHFDATVQDIAFGPGRFTAFGVYISGKPPTDIPPSCKWSEYKRQLHTSLKRLPMWTSNKDLKAAVKHHSSTAVPCISACSQLYDTNIMSGLEVKLHTLWPWLEDTLRDFPEPRWDSFYM